MDARKHGCVCKAYAVRRESPRCTMTVVPTMRRAPNGSSCESSAWSSPSTATAAGCPTTTAGLETTATAISALSASLVVGRRSSVRRTRRVTVRCPPHRSSPARPLLRRLPARSLGKHCPPQDAQPPGHCRTPRRKAACCPCRVVRLHLRSGATRVCAMEVRALRNLQPCPPPPLSRARAVRCKASLAPGRSRKKVD